MTAQQAATVWHGNPKSMQGCLDTWYEFTTQGCSTKVVPEEERLGLRLNLWGRRGGVPWGRPGGGGGGGGGAQSGNGNKACHRYRYISLGGSSDGAVEDGKLGLGTGRPQQVDTSWDPAFPGLGSGNQVPQDAHDRSDLSQGRHIHVSHYPFMMWH